MTELAGGINLEAVDSEESGGGSSQSRKAAMAKAARA
jgi:hypothetical protein